MDAASVPFKQDTWFTQQVVVDVHLLDDQTMCLNRAVLNQPHLDIMADLKHGALPKLSENLGTNIR